MPYKIKIGIVENHFMVRDAFSAMLSRNENFEINLLASHGIEMIRTLEVDKSNLPDVLLMDIEMPVMNGIEATKYLKVHFPEVKVIMVSMNCEKHIVERSLLSGAKSFIHKSESLENLYAAILDTYKNDIHFNKYVTQETVQGLKSVKSQIDLHQGISKNGMEILSLLAAGKTTNEIALSMNLSPRTVEGHRSKLYKLLDVESKNVSMLIKKARKFRLVGR